jgi:hypothetical protein
LIEFDKEVLKNSDHISLTPEEESIMNKINDISVNSEYDNAIPEDDIGFAGVKLNQLGMTTYVFLAIGITISIVIIFGGLFMLKKDKKPKDKKKRN